MNAKSKTFYHTLVYSCYYDGVGRDSLVGRDRLHSEMSKISKMGSLCLMADRCSPLLHHTYST